MSYGRLQAKEQALSAEIDDLIEKAKRCDQDADKAYHDKTGYEIPDDVKFKQDRLAKIKAAKQALEQREQPLNPGKAIDAKKQISFADTEACIMGKNGGGFDYAYNARISVDADLQIPVLSLPKGLLARHISQNANDKQEVEPALQALQGTTGRSPEKLSADNGYWSGDNPQALEQNDVDAYIATDKGEKTHKIPLDGSERKLATEPAKVIYGQRKTIVEPVFGQIKNSGFRGFSVRGKA